MTEPKVFLSPSSKGYQISPVTEKSEADIMRLLAEEIKKNLDDLGIETVISEIGSTPNQSVESSNKEKAALHVVLSTLKASNDTDRGIKIYFSSSDALSRDYASVFAKNLKEIYPIPQFVTTQPNGSFVELLNTESPSVVISIGNQSNAEDAAWLAENSGDVAQNIAASIGEILGIKAETTPLTALGLANGTMGFATVRKSPSPTAKIITRIINGSPVRIIGKIGNWYAILASNIEGYVLESEISNETPEQ